MFQTFKAQNVVFIFTFMLTRGLVIWNITRIAQLLIFCALDGGFIITVLFWPLRLFKIILPLSRTMGVEPGTLSYKSAFGPFVCNPFNTNCVISPLLFVPKRVSDELHIVSCMTSVIRKGLQLMTALAKIIFSVSVSNSESVFQELIG